MSKYNETSLYKKVDEFMETISVPETFDDLSDGDTNKAFTGAMKVKLDGISSGATSNDTDANLKNRSNHTGSQLASTISDFSSAVDARVAILVDGAPDALNTLNEIAEALGGDPDLANTLTNAIALKASQTDLTALAARVTALETWKSNIKLNRAESFTTTTDANGDFTLTTSVSFTNPVVVGIVRATAGAEGYHVCLTGVSGTSITGRAFKNKTQAILLGGTIDPDSPVASSTTIHVLVVEPV